MGLNVCINKQEVVGSCQGTPVILSLYHMPFESTENTVQSKIDIRNGKKLPFEKNTSLTSFVFNYIYLFHYNFDL